MACTAGVPRLRDRYQAELTLVGAGSEGARKAASDPRLSHVAFAGRVAPAEIWRFYADADLYLQTPDIDNMPTSVLEAFASGCAVVATSAGGVPAILTDQMHGLLVPCNDDQAAGAAIIRLLEDPALARRLTDQALESCARYQWSAVRPQWVGLYQSVASAPGVPEHTPA